MEGLFEANVVRNDFAARATRWITLRLGGDRPVEVGPGNIISVSLPQGIKRPYTICRAQCRNREIQLLVRVIDGGVGSNRMAELKPGETLPVQGSWGRPIREQIHPHARLVVGISSGTGVGPLVGFAGETELPMTLLAGFRTSSDLCVDELPRGVRLHVSLSAPSKTWTGMRGRTTVSGPGVLDTLTGAHVHLVGNGEMVNTWAEALRRSGAPVVAVTSEVYFNKRVPLDEEAIERLTHQLVRRHGPATRYAIPGM